MQICPYCEGARIYNKIVLLISWDVVDVMNNAFMWHNRSLSEMIDETEANMVTDCRTSWAAFINITDIRALIWNYATTNLMVSCAKY